MNVRGIGNNNKRRETFNWLRNKQQSIIFLQEVHCTEATIDMWRSEWGYKALFTCSCLSSNSAGICILFNNNFKFDILKTFLDPSGHYIICDIKTDEKLFTLANIYAPNEDDPTFFKQVFDRLHDFACEEIIVGGDFNLVFDVKEDKKGGLPRTHQNAYRLNSKKTEALWIGSCAGKSEKLYSEKDFNWKNTKVKVLGVWLSTHQEITTKLNFSEKIEKMRNCLGCWSVRRLSLIGKITVLKSLIASQVIHLLSPLQVNSQIIKQINDLFFEFLWNSKGDKIKRNVITQDYGNGGLRMIDIASFNKALKSVWIRKYLDESNKGKWKIFFDAELEKLGGQTVFRGNLDIKDSKKLAINLSPFLKEILEIWSELNFQGSIETVESFLTQSLWYNSLIRIMDKPVFYKSWYQMGISHVNQIVKEQPSTFLSQTEFESKYHTKVCPLTLYGMTSTLRELWKNKKPPSIPLNCKEQVRVFRNPLFNIEKAQQTGLSKTGGSKM